MLDKNEVQKISAGYRILCFFVALLCFIALMGVLAFGRDEGVSIGIVLVSLAPVLLLYIFVPIIFTGYPPRLLRWALGKKE